MLKCGPLILMAVKRATAQQKCFIKYAATSVNFFKVLATINLPKSTIFLGNFCKGVKIYLFSIEIIFGQLL